MKQITIPLKKDLLRPIAFLKDWHRFYAMIDTGALFPIWVAEEDTLISLNAKLLSRSVKFSGFGGTVNGKLYKLPYFQMGDLIYPNLHIVLCEMAMPCQMILSATMFHNLRYEIDNENHMLNVSVPDSQSNIRNLVIKDTDGRMQVFCTSGEV